MPRLWAEPKIQAKYVHIRSLCLAAFHPSYLCQHYLEGSLQDKMADSTFVGTKLLKIIADFSAFEEPVSDQFRCLQGLQPGDESSERS